jgi:hypothetical protein
MVDPAPDARGNGGLYPNFKRETEIFPLVNAPGDIPHLKGEMGGCHEPISAETGSPGRKILRHA